MVLGIWVGKELDGFWARWVDHINLEVFLQADKR